MVTYELSVSPATGPQLGVPVSTAMFADGQESDARHAFLAEIEKAMSGFLYGFDGTRLVLLRSVDGRWTQTLAKAEVL